MYHNCCAQDVSKAEGIKELLQIQIQMHIEYNYISHLGQSQDIFLINSAFEATRKKMTYSIV